MSSWATARWLEEEYLPPKMALRSFLEKQKLWMPRFNMTDFLSVATVTRYLVSRTTPLTRNTTSATSDLPLM